MVRVRVTTAAGQGVVYLHGAHVTSYQPTGQTELLFMSEASQFALDQPIRGGVPICFPWFAAKPGDANAPAHGLARTHAWTLSDIQATESMASLQFHASFPPFSTVYQITFGASLELGLVVVNEGSEATTFEAALHTYLAIGDVHRVWVEGLEQAAFFDQLTGQRSEPNSQPIRFRQETDRIYESRDQTITLVDSVLQRRIVIDRDGSPSVVVWNPWVDKSRRMSDFGDEEWQTMCCLETAAVRDHAICLQPGENHALRVTHRVEPFEPS